MKERRTLDIARIYYPVTALGPGRRVGIWTMGCPRRCPGCISPELWRTDPAREMTPGEILAAVERMLEVSGGRQPVRDEGGQPKASGGRQPDGFTISGGEPFLRPEALAEFLEGLLLISDDILVYTGYTYRELRAMKNPCVDRAIACCAALVDGPYLEEENDGVGLRGSANQQCHVFRHQERYRGMEQARRLVQNVILPERVLTFGIPGKGGSE